MQKILSFNTIFSEINILLQIFDNVIFIENFKSEKQSEILISSIEEVLNKNNLNYNDIDIYSSISGPGNFTSIKTNLAVLKALQISTNKKIITNNIFEIISFKEKYDIIILNLNNIKYYIKEKESCYTIFKKDIGDFLNNKNDLKILTNDLFIKGNNIIYSEFTNSKWKNLIDYKAENNIFIRDIMPFYIEEATITKRKK